VLELRRKYFREPYPADTIVEVNGLYTPEAMIEIDAVAVARAGDLARLMHENRSVAMEKY
jgi:hypothetical protein